MLTTNYFNIGDRVARLRDRSQGSPGVIIGLAEHHAVIVFDATPCAPVRLSFQKLVQVRTQKAGAR